MDRSGCDTIKLKMHTQSIFIYLFDEKQNKNVAHMRCIEEQQTVSIVL